MTDLTLKEVLADIAVAKNMGRSINFDNINPFDGKPTTKVIMDELSKSGYRLYSYLYNYGKNCGLKVDWSTI